MEALYWFNQQGQRYQTAEEKLNEQATLVERYRQQFGELPNQ